MTARPSILSRLRRLFRPKDRAPVPARIKPPPVRRSRVPTRSIEALEGRIAPAMLLPGGQKLTYTESDGDLVTLTFSKALFSTNSGSADQQLRSVFQFTSGFAHTGASDVAGDVPQQLEEINLAAFTVSGVETTGLSIILQVSKSANGDGLANVGDIEASNITLGTVVVPGDLGHINAGTNSNVIGLAALNVHSLGKLTTTQSGTPDFTSTITGALGSFTADTVEGAYLDVISGFGSSDSNSALGRIGSITITHYLKPRDMTANLANDGVIQAESSIESIRIGSGLVNSVNPELSDGINGGAGSSSGSIVAGGYIRSIAIDGSLRGGAGSSSGAITAQGPIGDATITKGLLGGGDSSGALHAAGYIQSATIGTGTGPGLVGGSGADSGLLSSDQYIVAATISSIQGGSANSGGLLALGPLGNITVTGSVTGGTGNHSGFIESDSRIVSVAISHDLAGLSDPTTAAGASNSGMILSSGDIGTVLVYGSVQGGAGAGSGGIYSGSSGQGDIGYVGVGDGLLGGGGSGSGIISSGGQIGTVDVYRLSAGAGYGGDAILGGSGIGSGEVYAFGSIGLGRIYGNIHGGPTEFSGTIQEHGVLGFVGVGGSVLGGDGLHSGGVFAYDTSPGSGGAIGTFLTYGSITGGGGESSGIVSSDGPIASLTTGGLFAGAGPQSGAIVSGTGFSAAGNIGSLSLGNVGQAATTGANPTAARAGGTVTAYGAIDSLIADQLQQAAIHVVDSLSLLGVRQDMVGSTVTVGGQANFDGVTDLALARLIVLGQVDHSSVLAGYTVTGAPVNGHAQIGTVQVNGSWAASNLIAGVQSSDNQNFGATTDSPIADSSAVTSRIASIIIGGAVSGTAAGGDHFGFVAHQIGSFQSSAGPLNFTSAPAEVFELAPATGDVTAREV